MTTIPVMTRLGIDIPKPKDWQSFQRLCVLLYKEELKDPHVHEYGRNGQNQRGIDILGRRDGRNDYFVGIQCKLRAAPLTKAAILSDARSALKLKADIKELIFATTAPNDTRATDAAIAVSQTLAAEGHQLTVFVYGWDQLQTLIAQHEPAYNAFHPSSVGSSSPRSTGLSPSPSELATLVRQLVVEQMGGANLTTASKENVARADEDPALHARIDIFRDLFKEQSQPLLAEQGLLAIEGKEDLSAKPWARFRIETNLAAIAGELGREAQAAKRFESAYSIFPEDPLALCNLALARISQGRFPEAMTAAQAALDCKPRAEQAVAYLLQAAARSEWQGEPESLIPSDLVGSPHADIGLAEFLRRRDAPDWAQRTLGMARRHIDLPEFKRIRALAVLTLAIESESIIAGGHGPVTGTELNAAADDIKALAEHYLDIGFADVHDLMAYLNNAAVLLRLCERHAECEALLSRGIPKVGDQPQLRRLLALALLAQNQVGRAISSLEADNDPENQIFRSELQTSIGKASEALSVSLAVDTTGLPRRLLELRWRVIGEAALQLRDPANLTAAIAGLRSLEPNDITASLFEIRGKRRTLADDDGAREQLRELATSVPADLDMVSRYLLASELRNQDLHDECSYLLEGHVDLSRPSPSTSLYLQSLAASRRDETFQRVLASVPVELREAPETLWMVAAHAWNRGDLNASIIAVDALLARDPKDSSARLLKIEILIRQDRSGELLSQLEQPLEHLPWKRQGDLFRLASLLGHFGFAERAAALGYRLFLQHRDLAVAWMTLIKLILGQGVGHQDRDQRWASTCIGPDTAVDLVYDDGTEAFFVIEPDAALRKLDPDSWEPDHALVRAVMHLKTGSQFAGSDGRHGVVRQVHHKYVARLHYVMAHYETRFPEIFGLKRISVSAEEPGGLDELIAQLKERHDWVLDAETQYQKSPMMLGILAHRLGMDTIDVSTGMATHGAKLKVAVGNLEEREAAHRAIRLSRRCGCVLDLWTFWTAWQLHALEVVQQECGPIHLPQGVLDRLRARRDRFQMSAHDGLTTGSYRDGKVVLQEASAEVVTTLRDETDRAIAWIEANATVLPVAASDALPAQLRQQLQVGWSDVFDAVILAHQSNILLITDDLASRELYRLMNTRSGAWLHAVLGVALDRRSVDIDRYTRWSASLVEGGHNYLGVSAVVLARAAYLDAKEGQVPGYLFSTLSQLIGGRNAEAASHARVTIECLQLMWSDRNSTSFRERATDHLLWQLSRERWDDYVDILRTVTYLTQNPEELSRRVKHFLRGHFYLERVLGTKT